MLNATFSEQICMTSCPSSDGAPKHAEDAWKHATRTADAAFKRGDHYAATDGHRNALHIAEGLLSSSDRAGDPVDAPALLVASHHNLAEVALARGLGLLALEHFRNAFERMLWLAQAKTAPFAIRQSSAAQLQPSLTALATHTLSCGAPLHALQRDIRHARRITCGPNIRH
jgi:hypothetical protein